MKKMIGMLFLQLAFGSFLVAQSQIKNYSFKKGEVLDVLLLSAKPNYDSLFAIYRKTAFPVAMRMSYTPIPGFRIQTYTQGNFQPESFILGKWASLAQREQFLAEIETHVPDFHQQRRNIFSDFHLTYYEMLEDISFEVNKGKTIVATAYWRSDKESFQRFQKQWLKAVKKEKGKMILSLEEGKSPFGYFYQPDWMIITEWESLAEFEAFQDRVDKLGVVGLQHINQFILQ